MAKTKAEKAVIIEKLEKALKEGASSVFVHFKALNVADETTMRRSLRAAGVSYFVAKKTLIRRALSALGHKHEEMPLDGEIAVASGGGDDATAAARLVHESAKKFTDPGRAGKLSILGGLFEGNLLDMAAMQAIATIPPLATLRAMFAQLINSPRARFAVVLSKVAEKKV